MPDLTPSAIEAWLTKHGSAALPGASVGSENGPEVLPGVVRLGHALDQALSRSILDTESLLTDPTALSHMQPVMAHFGPARRLRMLHWLSDAGFKDPRGIVEGVTAPAADGTGQSIRQWLLDLQRRDLLAAIFAPDRLNLLLAACRETAQPEPRS